jgi:hypothetical protein
MSHSNRKLLRCFEEALGSNVATARLEGEPAL